VRKGKEDWPPLKSKEEFASEVQENCKRRELGEAPLKVLNQTSK